MASDAQIMANRINAQSSTGPRTAGGIRRIADNARRHGLTSAKPDADAILNFYRLLIDEYAGSLAGPAGAAFKQASYRLAGCEVRHLKICDALTALDKCFTLLAPGEGDQGRYPALQDALQQDSNNDDVHAEMAKKIDFEFITEHGLSHIFKHPVPQDAAFIERKKFLRYRAEGESQRRKAFRHWIACRKILCGNRKENNISRQKIEADLFQRMTE